MWKLIIAELNYYKRQLLTIYFFSIPILFTYIYFGSKDLAKPDKWQMLGLWLIFLMAIILWGYTNADKYRTKMIRYYSFLPIRRSDIITMFYLFPLLLWLGLIFIYWLFYYFSSGIHSQSNPVWKMLNISGILFIIITVRILFNDLKYITLHKKQKILSSIIAFILIQLIFWPYLITLFSTYEVRPYRTLHNNVPDFLLTEFSTVIYLAISIVLIICSMYVFLRRKSYVE